MDTSCLYVTVCIESLYLKGAIGYIEYRQLYPNWIYGSRCISKMEMRVQNAYLSSIFGTIGSHIESWDSRYENLEFRKLKVDIRPGFRWVCASVCIFGSGCMPCSSFPK